MRLLLVLPVPLCASLTIGHMAGFTQSPHKGWQLHLLKLPHCPLTEKVSAMPLPLTALAAPVALRIYIFVLKRSGVVGSGEGEI